MSKIDNFQLVKCRLFLIQIKNWIEKRYGSENINYYIYDFDTDIELQIEMYVKESKIEKNSDEIYRYISKTFADPDLIKLEMMKKQNRIKIIVKCRISASS